MSRSRLLFRQISPRLSSSSTNSSQPASLLPQPPLQLRARTAYAPHRDTGSSRSSARYVSYQAQPPFRMSQASSSNGAGPAKMSIDKNGKDTGAKATKRRIIESDDDEVEQPPRKAQEKAAAAAPPKKDAFAALMGGRTAKASSSGGSSSAAKATGGGSSSAPAKSSQSPGASSKGKQKASEEPEVVESDSASDSAFEADSAEDDDMKPQEEKKAAKQIASIFLKQDDKVAPKVSWKAGEPVPYAALAETFAKIEATTKRLEILQYLTTFLRRVIERSPDDLIKVIYLCINRLCPDYEGLELGIGESLLMKAIAQSTGRTMDKLKEEMKKEGDLGQVAVNSRQKQKTMFKPKPLTVPNVFRELTAIAKMSGNQSQQRKIDNIVKLLAACVDQEPKYLIRSLEGKLRIGLAERSVVVSLAQAIVYVRNADKKISEATLAQRLEEGTNIVKSVYSELPSHDLVIPALLEAGPEGLRARCKLTPGVPLKPMLAKPTKEIGEVLDRFEGKAFTCEYKYDGERAQVHYLENGKLAIFSRNSENMSNKYPDLVETVPKITVPSKNVKSFCLDCEAVAWKQPETNANGETVEGHLLPFQELSRRKRKDVKVEDIKVKVKLFAFDLLYLNGEPLLQLDLAARRKLLREHFNPVENEFDFARSEDCTTVEEIQTFLDASVKDSCEGLMVKMLEGPAATYAPSQRSQNWLKLKKDYLAGTGDSLDLVVLGAFYGKGKRTNVYGAFLLGCYDADTETYQAICKIGTGFSEEDLGKFYETLKPLELTTKKGYYDVGEAKPDVFFEPQVVFEVLTADLSLSPVYTVGKGAVDHRGISLRFPRFIRLRDDKGPEDSTTPEQVVEMYKQQQSVAAGRKGAGGGDGDDDGFW